MIRLAGRSITVVFSVTVLFKTDVFAGAQGRNVLGSSAICCLVSGKVFYCSPGSRWFAAQDLQHSLINGKIAHFIRCPARSSQLCTGTKHSRVCARAFYIGWGTGSGRLRRRLRVRLILTGGNSASEVHQLTNCNQHHWQLQNSDCELMGCVNAGAPRDGQVCSPDAHRRRRAEFTVLILYHTNSPWGRPVKASHPVN